MRPYLKIVLFFSFLLGSSHLRAQTDSLLTNQPTTKEEFIASEPYVIHTVDFLENTPFDQQADLRRQETAELIKWIVNSPTVTVSISQNLLPFEKKNAELLLVFMGGWTRYSLLNGYSKDPLQCNMAGIQSAIKVYKREKGKGLKKDKEMDKIIEADEKGELDKWVSGQLAKK